MGRFENMEMERSRREHEHAKKFGRIEEHKFNPEEAKAHNERVLEKLRGERLRHSGQGSHDPMYPDSHKNK